MEIKVGTLLRLKKPYGIYGWDSQGEDTPTQMYPVGTTALYEGLVWEEGTDMHSLLILTSRERTPWWMEEGNHERMQFFWQIWEVVEEPSDATEHS